MPNDITLTLKSAAKDGNQTKSDELLPLIYNELRKLARSYMSRELRSDHTLQATALVHEAWLRLASSGDPTWQNRSHFFAAASTAMRRILIDHARQKSGLKRGGGQMRIDINRIELADSKKEEAILMVDEAIERLEQINPQRAKIVVLRFFGGMTNKEAAEVLGIGERTVARQWVCARIWLMDTLHEQS